MLTLLRRGSVVISDQVSEHARSSAYHELRIYLVGHSQSAENRRKECNEFWLRLRHTVILTSNVSFKENKPDGVDTNSNDLDYCVRKNEEKILWVSADFSRKATLMSR